MQARTWEREGYAISTDPAWLDLDRIHRNLAATYWAKGIPFETVRKCVANSLCFGIYVFGPEDSRVQVGFARAVSDFATFAYIGDVYVEAEFRGRGLSKWVMLCIREHPELQGLRRICLGTHDAHGLYAQFGFKVMERPENWMEIKAVDPYMKDR